MGSRDWDHTWTPRMPKMMKNVQQISTMFPIGLSDDISVWTTSFSPGARLMTLQQKHKIKWSLYCKNQDAIFVCQYRAHLRGRSERRSRTTRKIPNIRGLAFATIVINTSISEIDTRMPSILFQPFFKYAFSPYQSPVATTYNGTKQHILKWRR